MFSALEAYTMWYRKIITIKKMKTNLGPGDLVHVLVVSYDVSKVKFTRLFKITGSFMNQPLKVWVQS